METELLNTITLPIPHRLCHVLYFDNIPWWVTIKILVSNDLISRHTYTGGEGGEKLYALSRMVTLRGFSLTACHYSPELSVCLVPLFWWPWADDVTLT